MKIKKGVISALVVIVLIVAALAFAATREKNSGRNVLAQRIFDMGSDNQGSSIEEIKSSIAAYEKRIEQHVKDAAQTGAYWKILAVRLQDRGLHREALDALEQAINYMPVDPALHYFTGISAGIMAKSVHVFPGSDPGEKNRYFLLAENAFLRAIELDSRYLRPRYGLAVLYVFELERPEEAIPHLERCLEISRNDVDSMAVLARAYYMLDNLQAAVELYDRIISITKDEQKKLDAQNLRQFILGQMYG